MSDFIHIHIDGPEPVKGSVVIPYRGFEISISTVGHCPELQIFRGAKSIETLNPAPLVGCAESIRKAMKLIDAIT